jgi:hypothetical protein
MATSTNKGKRGRSSLLPKPWSNLPRFFHVGTRGTCE